MKKYLAAFTFTLLVSCQPISADTPEVPLKEIDASLKTYPNIATTEFTLSNGMKISLKPTTFEEDEIMIRLDAKGGFSLYNPSQRAAVELSGQVLLESGFTDLTPDKLSVLLYETSSEFAIEIKALSRSIEAISPSDELETVLKLINFTFTKQEFKEDKFKNVMNLAKNSVKKRTLDFDTAFEDAYITTNTENLAALRPLSEADIERADFATSQKFLEYAFANPDDFVCVIVGDFKEETIKPLIEKYLASIPSKKLKTEITNPVVPTFPKGITTKNVLSHKPGESLVRLTFPMQVEVNEKNVFAVELACQLIEERLRDKIKAQFSTTQGVDVAYEFPLYPSLEFSWISIQFRQDPKSVDAMIQLILKELKFLQNLGPTLFDLENAKLQQRQSDEYWLKQNDFWLASLSNYYLVGWDPKNIILSASKEKKVSVDKIREVIKNNISLKNYSIIKSIP